MKYVRAGVTVTGAPSAMRSHPLRALTQAPRSAGST